MNKRLHLSYRERPASAVRTGNSVDDFRDVVLEVLEWCKSPGTQIGLFVVFVVVWAVIFVSIFH